MTRNEIKCYKLCDKIKDKLHKQCILCQPVFKRMNLKIYFKKTNKITKRIKLENKPAKENEIDTQRDDKIKAKIDYATDSQRKWNDSTRDGCIV